MKKLEELLKTKTELMYGLKATDEKALVSLKASEIDNFMSLLEEVNEILDKIKTVDIECEATIKLLTKEEQTAIKKLYAHFTTQNTPASPSGFEVPEFAENIHKQLDIQYSLLAEISQTNNTLNETVNITKEQTAEGLRDIKKKKLRSAYKNLHF